MAIAKSLKDINHQFIIVMVNDLHITVYGVIDKLAPQLNNH